MNRFMFLSSKLLLMLLVICGAIGSVSGQVVISVDPPETNLLVDQLIGGIGSRIFSEAGSDNHARGQAFSLEAGATEITGITIRKNAAQTFSNDTLTVRIFAGTELEFNAGTGHTTAANGSDFFNGTEVTELYSEPFTIDGEFANFDYVTFNFATPVQVNGGTDFGFLLTYQPSVPAADPVDEFFQYFESQGQGGGRLSVTTTDHGGPSSRTFNYAILGTGNTSVLLGDANCDGVVNFLDITPFIALLSGDEFKIQADIDGNGLINFLDITPFIAILTNT